MMIAASGGHENIRVLSDNTDVFVLLVYWTWKNGMAMYKISMQQ